MEDVSKGFKTKSDKIRALHDAGYPRADIARFLGIRYQHVRNVLVRAEDMKSKHAEKSGVAERAVGPEGIRTRMRLKMDAGGRIVLPPAVREAMNIGENGNVLAWLENGELRLVSPQVALKQVQVLARELLKGNDSLADELIAERREEARRESKDG
jgi:bifunctional DNA-binding transcriptional regulator/antitoxin component of YhaV-PrlF toxin-antitoxin module